MPFVAVPNSGQSLGQTRDQIRNNLNELKSSLAVNHYDLDLSNVGKHMFMQMPVQGSLPATAMGEGELHTQTVSSLSQLFYSRDNVAGTLVQMTAGDTSQASFRQPNPGWTFLPGGIIMQYGISPVVNATTKVITYPIPFTSQVFNIQATPQRQNSSPGSTYGWFVENNTLSLTQFTIQDFSGHSYGYYWVAIGI